ncbi:hypothetical protein EPI10_023482 [Gossypium australe]|uniref:Reverse transcriptase n=1 Tax=Gossypium australe TaxID=47621 RepID=A0A5B6VVR5_9ROSI|nr:hypothetical protein EPI10_023482 [Gossypium australe]
MLRRLGRNQATPWLVCGDFNEILYSFEKEGSLLRDEGGLHGNKGTFLKQILKNDLTKGLQIENGSIYFLNTQSDICLIPLLTIVLYFFKLNKRGRVKEGKILDLKHCGPWRRLVKRLWAMSRGGVMEKLELVGKGLQRWAIRIKKLCRGLLKKLLARNKEHDGMERTNENLAEQIDAKIYLNLEIEKEERY